MTTRTLQTYAYLLEIDGAYACELQRLIAMGLGGVLATLIWC